MTVFDVDEEKEEDLVEEVAGSIRNAENGETAQNDVTAVEGESKSTAGREDNSKYVEPEREESLQSEADEKQVAESIPDIDSVLETEQKNSEAEILTAEASTEICKLPVFIF